MYAFAPANPPENALPAATRAPAGPTLGQAPLRRRGTGAFPFPLI